MADKRVFVTGGARGIGREITTRLAADGWKVAVHYGHGRHEAEDLVRQLGNQSAGAYQADLSDPKQVRGLIDRALADGPLDALVNNAGVYLTLDFAGATDDQFEASLSRCLKVNYEAPAWLTRSVCRHFMTRGGGKVVNVASRVGHRGEAGAATYSATKAALINMTRALAVEHGAMNIQHYAIAPGWVETAFTRPGLADQLPAILKGIPLGRVATAADCANAISFLLRPESDYLSGIVLDINGASYLR